MTLLLLTWLMGCDSPWDDSAAPPLVLTTPRVGTASLSCDAEKAKWTLDLTATSWTNGVSSAWSQDGQYVEIHDLEQQYWAADGSSETFELSLNIVDNWDDQKDGKSTIFTCGSAPQVIAVVLGNNNTVTDCRDWGSNPDLWSTVDGIQVCNKDD